MSLLQRVVECAYHNMGSRIRLVWCGVAGCSQQGGGGMVQGLELMHVRSGQPQAPSLLILSLPAILRLSGHGCGTWWPSTSCRQLVTPVSGWVRSMYWACNLKPQAKLSSALASPPLLCDFATT